MAKIIIKNAEEKDSALINHLARKCPPLDVHTPYTYWVLCQFFNKSCFIMYDESTPIGYITALDTEQGTFIWQIGILESYQGKGYASLLIEKVHNHAESRNCNMLVTIDRANTKSYNAFKSYCQKNSLRFEETGSLSLTDLDAPLFNENEIIYEISK